MMVPTKRLVKGCLLLVCMATVILLYMGRYSIERFQETHVSIESDAENVFRFASELGATPQKVSHEQRKHVLVIGRMSSGTTAIGRLLSDHANFFYAYEPGHMLFKIVYDKHVFIDSNDNLQDIQPALCSFLEDLYDCDFSSQSFFLKAINSRRLYNKWGTLPNLTYPVAQDEAASFCRSNPNIMSKVVRLNDVTSCLPALKRNKVKMVFLARDPRGVVSSRLRRWTKVMTFLDTVGRANYYPLTSVVKEHCDWLEMVFNLLKDAPDWLKENTMLIRFEDMCLYPEIITKALFNFVGLEEPAMNRTMSESRNETAVGWMNARNYQQLKEVQDACPKHIYDDFGWKTFKSEDELQQVKLSWYSPMPRNTVYLNISCLKAQIAANV
ncbi:carbohydrate sulfotransferase 1-like [Ptychodera flava]|uniref:carbohydrate sulfotransferase 1-like n=1 Tax=Ptychodera flava TaxID=63121 RepID=UPI00396AA0A6